MQDDPDLGIAPPPIAEADTTSLARIQTTKLLAPVWHTALIVLLAATASIAGARSMKHLVGTARTNNLPSYFASMAMEWALAGIVLWGLHLRRTPLREVLGEKSTSRQSDLPEWLIDAGAALVFWLVSLVVLGLLAAALQGFICIPKISGGPSRNSPPIPYPNCWHGRRSASPPASAKSSCFADTCSCNSRAWVIAYGSAFWDQQSSLGSRTAMKD